MANYDIQFRKSVFNDLKPVPSKDVRKIMEAIRSLAVNPRPPQSKKLSGGDKYRLRWGHYRVLYEIRDQLLIVCVVKIGHRRDAYQR